MRCRRASFPLTLVAALCLTPAAAQERAAQPLIIVEPYVEALAHHLGLKSWSFVDNAYFGEYLDVGLSYHRKGKDGAWQRTNFGTFRMARDPSGQQRLAVILGPDGDVIPATIQINEAFYGAELSGFRLSGFNSGVPSIPGMALQPDVGDTTFILLASYPEVNGNVVATGNPDDMDAYLALELGQGGR
jgi:hypothetical protein